MNDQLVDRLILLYSVYTQKAPPSVGISIQSAETELMTTLLIPEAIPATFALFQKCPEESVRKLAGFRLQDLISKFLPNLPPNAIAEIKANLLQAILNEPSYEVRCILCEVVQRLKLLESRTLKQKSISIEWPELLDFATRLLQEPKMLSTGFVLWQSCINDLDKLQLAEIGKSLIVLACQSLQSDDITVRMQAMNILFSFIWSSLPLEPYLPQLIPSIVGALQSAFCVRQILEECQYYQNAIEICSSRYENELIPPISELCFSLIREERLPLQLRVKAFNIFDKIVTYVIDGMAKESLIELIQVILQLSLETLCAERDVDDFNFADSFLSYAVSASEDTSIAQFIFNTVFASVSQNDNPCQRQVALFALTSIVSSSLELFEENEEAIVSFCLECGNIDDEYVISWAFRLLSEMATYLPNGLDYTLEQSVEFIFVHASHYEALNTLDTVLSQTTRPHNSIQELIGNLAGRLSSSPEVIQEGLLTCIASALEPKPDSTSEEFYAFLKPVLTGALSSQELVPSAIRTFGLLVKYSPISIANELNSIMTVLAQAINVEANLSLAAQSITSVAQIADYLPQAFGPFAPAISSQLMGFLQNNPIKKDAKANACYDDETPLSACQCASLHCLSVLISNYEQQMGPCIVPIYQYINDVMEHSTNLSACAFNCIRILAPALSHNNIGFDVILQKVFSTVSRCYAKLPLIALHEMLPSLVYAYSPDQNNILAALLLILKEVQEPNQLYLDCPDLSQCISVSMMKIVFDCLELMINAAAPCNEQIYEGITQAFHTYITSPCERMSMHSLCIHAVLFARSPPNPELLQVLVSHLPGMLSKATLSAHGLAYRAAIYLLFANAQQFHEFVQPLLTIASNELSLSRYASIFIATEFMVTKASPKIETIQYVLDAIEVRRNDDMLNFVMHIVLYGNEKWPTINEGITERYVVALFTSCDWYLQKTPSEVLNRMAVWATTRPPDAIAEQLKHNQKLMAMFQQNVARFSTPGQ